MRAARLCIEMQEAFEEKFCYEKRINDIKRKKNPEGIWADLAALRSGIERIGAYISKTKADIRRSARVATKGTAVMAGQ